MVYVQVYICGMVLLIYGSGPLPIRIRPTRFPGVRCMLGFEAYSGSRESVDTRGVMGVVVDGV